MPRSGKRKVRRPQGGSTQPPRLALTSFGPKGTDHEAFRAAATAAARASVDEFPKTLDRLKARFRDRDPASLLTSVAVYGLFGSMRADGDMRKVSKDIEQHHVELLQAVALMVPETEWGPNPCTMDVVQAVFDDLPALANTFLFTRILAADNAADETHTLLSLQERIRLHTQGVRNWGYFNDVIRLTKEIYSPLDAQFSAKLGFGISELVDVAHTLVKELEHRITAHWDVLGKVMQGKTVSQVVARYYKYVPGLEGTSEQLAGAFPPGADRKQVISMLIQHFDLRLAEHATVTAEEIAAVSGIAAEKVKKILAAVSCSPGALESAAPERLFLGNPIWQTPGIAVGDGYLFAIPQAVLSHINGIVHRLAKDAGLTKAVEKRRAVYLEGKVEETLRIAFSSAAITPGAKWQVGTEQGETDMLVALDRAVILAEAKSHRLTPEALRGAPARMKRHIEDLVVDPSLQSARLEKFIEQAREGDADARGVMTTLGIDASKIDSVIRLSVTLDDLSVLGSAEADLKKVGWVPADHHLAPTILFADLICIVDILQNPLLILHYLSERIYLQKSFSLVGDELDFLGLYLVTLFNIAGLEKEVGLFSPTGMSKPIDRHYEGRDNGVSVAKPKLALQPLFRRIIERLADRKPAGWTTIGMHVLNAADPTEQRQIENALNKLRASVRKNFREPGHTCCVVITPPLARKACVVFYLFPEAHRASVKQNMEQFAEEALAEGRTACVVIAKSIDRWDAAYDLVLLAQLNKESAES